MEEEEVGNTTAKVDCKAMLDTLAAREKEVEVHTLGDRVSEIRGIKMLDTLSDRVAVNKVESLGETQVKVIVNALDYEMADR